MWLPLAWRQDPCTLKFFLKPRAETVKDEWRNGADEYESVKRRNGSMSRLRSRRPSRLRNPLIRLRDIKADQPRDKESNRLAAIPGDGSREFDANP